jgi:hypothetical protein
MTVTRYLKVEKRWPYAVASVVFLSLLFLFYLRPIISWDLWWHLATGEYVLEHGGLPETDPFTFTAEPEDPEAPGRVSFVLKQYWLAQIVMALIQKAGGLEAVIAYRALLFTFIGCSVLTLIALLGAGRGALVTLPIYLLATLPALGDGDRPQAHSFLFALLVVVLVEWSVARRSGRPLILAVPLTVLAANMHGGYLVGLGFIGVYAACSLFEKRLMPLRRALLLAFTVCVAASLLNPNAWYAWTEAVTMNLHRGFSARTASLEYRSAFEMMRYVAWKNHSWNAYWILMGLSVPGAVRFLLRGCPSRAILLLGVGAASLYGIRYFYFLVPLATAFGTVFVAEVLLGRSRPRPLLEGMTCSLLLVLVYLQAPHPNIGGIVQPLQVNRYPEKAADMLASVSLPERVFTEMNWGGYLAWRLWPQYKMFVDSRHLMSRVVEEYPEILASTLRGQSLMETRGIETVVMSAINPYSGKVYPLVRTLAEDPSWALVYHDSVALIFVRREQAPGELPKRDVYYHVLEESQRLKPLHPRAKRAYEATEIWALEQLGLNPPGAR